jgi:predicted N-acetyltransferase YhbS
MIAGITLQIRPETAADANKIFAVEAAAFNRPAEAELVQKLRQSAVETISLLAHPNYYPRFGFAPSAPLGLHCQFNVPEDVFMVTELVPGALRNKRGTVY